MATRTSSRTSNRSTASRKRSTAAKGSGSTARKSNERSAFAWGNGGTIAAAALAGAAVGLAANFGRKFVVQSISGAAGDWDEVLAAEHEAVMAIFDKMLATDSRQTWKRTMLLMQLEHALDKHAHEEEMIVYPALRDANMAHDAEHLNTEHGEIKTFLFELHQSGPEASDWLEKVRNFRDLVREHAHMEEEEVFPKFKQDLSDEQNDKITSLVNRDGFWQA